MEKLESLKGVFAKRIFKIPDYQRGYAWQARQLEDFWEDLINLPEGHHHYTGMITLKKADAAKSSAWIKERWLVKRGFKPFYVVDGQQRLTTIIIFINEFVNLMQQSPDNKDNSAKIIEEYLKSTQKDEANASSIAYKFSYEVDNPSFKCMQYRILADDSSEEIENTSYTKNLLAAKKFFQEKLLAYQESHGIEKVDDLFKKLTQNLKFNLYEISDDFDVFVAFETMNNRGKKLSYLELLKNRLIYLTSLFSDSEVSEDKKQIMRDDINEAWKKIYKQLGKDESNKLLDDDFLRDHWIIYFTYSRTGGNNFHDFLLNKHFTPQNIFSKKITYDDLAMYTKSIGSAASVWYNSFYPAEKENDNKDKLEEAKALKTLNRVGIAYFRPLVVAAYFNKKMTVEDRTKLFAEIERFIMLTFRMTRYSGVYRNNKYYSYAHKLYSNDDDTTADTIIQSLYNDLSGIVDIKDSSLISSSFMEYIAQKYKNNGGFYSWNGLTHLLFEYEEKLSGGNNQKIHWASFIKNTKNDNSIEHIYPQTPTDSYWVEGFKNYDDRQRKYLLGSIGNLVGLAKKYNSAASNKSYLDKKSSYREDGAYSARKIIDDYEEWTAESIKKRGFEILSFMEERWKFKFPNDKIKEELIFPDSLNKN